MLQVGHIPEGAAKMFGGFTLNNTKLPYLHFLSDTDLTGLSYREVSCLHGIRNFKNTCPQVHIKIHPVPH